MHALAATVASVAPMVQAHTQHQQARDVAGAMHEAVIEQQRKAHLDELLLEGELHTRDLKLQRELHFSQLSHDIELSRREAARDVWAQRSQHAQTLMVIDTLMFACAYAIVVQGDPPVESSVWLLRLYSLSQGISLSTLFVSIWLSLSLQRRMGAYDIHRPFVVYGCGRKHSNFESFFKCHCQRLHIWAFQTFYVGTGATISSAILFAFSKLYYDYSNLAAALVFTVISTIAIFMPLLVPTLQRLAGV